MNFNVVWTPAAEQELAAVWLAAEDRTAITTAATNIDRRLQRNPETLGDARFDTVRSFAFPPLGVDFEVLIHDHLVYVLSVWNLGEPEP